MLEERVDLLFDLCRRALPLGSGFFRQQRRATGLSTQFKPDDVLERADLDREERLKLLERRDAERKILEQKARRVGGASESGA